MTARVIAVANQKGGTAKTTTVVHLGVALAMMKQRVLSIDLDPQGHLAESFGIATDTLTAETSAVLEGSKDIHDILLKDLRPRLDLAPANIRLADMELTLVNMRFRETRLAKALGTIRDEYDYVLLDCPPSLGLLTVNALVAATHVLIPMPAEYLSMLGVSRLFATIDAIKAEANPALKILGVLPTHVRRTVHAREVIAQLQRELGDQLRIYPFVPDTTKFKDAVGQGKTIFDLAPDHEGASAYTQLGKEIQDATE